MIRALDTAANVKPFLAQLRDYRDPLGRAFEAIIRYYRTSITSAWAIQPDELAAILDAGFWFAPVFEGGKSSTQPGYYRAAQGEQDAAAALAMARRLGQPPSTAIYYAVDTDITGKTIDAVLEYFRPIAATHRAAAELNLWVGSYGDDLVNQRLQEEGLVDCGWIANAVGWKTDKKFQGWVIRQEPETKLPFGLGIDPNEVKDLAGAGFWRKAA